MRSDQRFLGLVSSVLLVAGCSDFVGLRAPDSGRPAASSTASALNDQVLRFSTYLGGNNSEGGVGIAVDAAGNVYVSGVTNSTNFPTTSGAVQPANHGGIYDVFVTKLNPNGSGLVYSTYLGGSGLESAPVIAVDAAGNAYLASFTNSTNFPTTPGAFQTAYGGGGSDGIIAMLNATGSGLVYSTYLGGGGDDADQCIAVDASGAAYVSGDTRSSNFPTTVGAFQVAFGGDLDDFVTKLNSTGTALVYSTFLGGNGADGVGAPGCIAVDGSGNAYVAGGSNSTNFPTTAGAYQTALAGGQDGFVTKLNPSGSGLVYSTRVGGTGDDSPYGIAVDPSGNAYLGGFTTSTDFPITSGAFETAAGGGGNDAFVTKLNPSGSGLVYSTFLGGAGPDWVFGIAINASGNAYVTGTTFSTDFPVSGAFQGALAGGQDAFVTQMNANGSGLLYSTYLGGGGNDVGSGIALDPSGSAVVTGSTESSPFPVTSAAFQTAYNGGGDAFVTAFATPTYPFTGFFPPVNNPDTVNVAKAGSAVPIKFSLGSNLGLNILSSGSPSSALYTCASGPTDAIDQTVAATNSGLQYDAAANQYTYVWKTDKSWSGTCRKFSLGLNDGSTHVALFQFR